MQQNQKSKRGALWLCICALFMAINIAFCSFSLPVPGGHLYFCDAVICTAAILLDPLGAFLVGGFGAFLGDFFFYPPPMFVSLVTHGLQAIVVSLCVRKLFKSKPGIGAGIGVTLGAIIVVVGYSIGRIFFYGDKSVEVALIKLPFEVLQAALGAILSMLLCYGARLAKVFEKRLGLKF